MPMVTQASDLKSLGRIHASGDEWFSHRKYGEMHAASVIDEAKQPLPNGVIVDLGDGLWQTYSTPREPGTFEGLLRGWNGRRLPKPPKPHRPVDLRAFAFLAAPKPERIYPSVVEPSGRYPVPAARGPEEIIARLERAGAKVRLARNGERGIVEASGGTPKPGILDLYDQQERLIVAWLKKDPLTCEDGPHKKPVAAVAIAAGGAALCDDCFGGAA
jgi:hypothetical protein